MVKNYEGEARERELEEFEGQGKVLQKDQDSQKRRNSHDLGKGRDSAKK
mgnify:FL=1